MRSSKASLAALVSGTLLVLSISGCGGDDAEPAAEPSPSTPSSSSTPLEPSESTSTEPATGKDPAAAAFLERLKAGMGEQGSVHVAMRMTGPADMTAQGDSTYGPDGSEMHLTMKVASMPGGSLEMVLVDGKAYLSMPGVNEPGQFFEIDKSNPAFGSLDDGLSPADSFAAFDAGLDSVEELGDAEVDGQSTTHYRLHVDAEKALEATGQGMVPGLPDELVYEVWLDSEDHMRRLTYELVGTELTMDMTRWGEAVDIQAPSKGSLVDPPPGM
jgi:hypothetical protein